MQLTKMSTSRISSNGPPLAVSAKSHLTISSLKKRARRHQNPNRHVLKIKNQHSLVETDLAKEVDGTTTTSSKGANHERLDALPAPPEDLPDVVHHRRFVRVGFETTQSLSRPTSLRGQRERTCSRSRKTGMEPKRGDASTGGVGEELEIVERPTAAVEPIEDGRPPGLLFVAVCKLDVCMREGIVGSGEFFESEDRDVGRRGGP